MPIGTYSIKVAWSGYADYSGTYDDVSNDVIGPVRWEIGMSRGHDRIAKVGTAEFTLDNSWFNYHGEFGLYSPENAGGSLYGNLVPMRIMEIACNYNEVDYSLFKGYVSEITPDPKAHQCTIRCVDGVEPWIRHMLNMPLQSNKRGDEIIAAILDLVYYPRAVSELFILSSAGAQLGQNTVLADASAGKALDPGAHTYALAGDEWPPDRVAAYRALEDIANSEWGRIWVGRDGTVNFWTAGHEFTDYASDASLTKTMTGLKIALRAGDIINHAIVDVTPREAGTGPTIVATLQSSVLCRAGAPQILNMRLRDPANEDARVAVSSIIAPVPSIDYTANTKSDGTGLDMTGNFSIATVLTATNVECTVTNSGAQAYLTSLQIRSSTPVYIYDGVAVDAEDADSKAAYIERKSMWHIPLGASIEFCQALANYLLLLFKDPYTIVDEIVLANSTEAAYTQILARTVMDIITVTEDSSGLSTEKMRIVGEKHALDAGAHDVAWVAEKIGDQTYWILEDATFGKLGETTWLGPL